MGSSSCTPQRCFSNPNHDYVSLFWPWQQSYEFIYLPTILEHKLRFTSFRRTLHLNPRLLSFRIGRSALLPKQFLALKRKNRKQDIHLFAASSKKPFGVDSSWCNIWLLLLLLMMMLMIMTLVKFGRCNEVWHLPQVVLLFKPLRKGNCEEPASSNYQARPRGFL